MASKKQQPDLTPKIVVTEKVSLELTLASQVLDTEDLDFNYHPLSYHQPDLAVLEDFVEQVHDYFGHDAARSLVDLQIDASGITATVRTEK